MEEVTIRQLCNHGGDVVDRVQAGERLMVTRSGRPVAELRPVPQRMLKTAVLLERWRHLPEIDLTRFRSDLDDVLDPAL